MKPTPTTTQRLSALRAELAVIESTILAIENSDTRILKEAKASRSKVLGLIERMTVETKPHHD